MDISTGAGLLFGLSFIGIVLLIVGTKDRINWRKIFVTIGVYSGIFSIFIIIVLVAITIKSNVESQFKKWKRSKGVENLAGISINSSLEDVVFIKGTPDIIGSNSFGGIIFMYRSADKLVFDNLLICFSERQSGLPSNITNRISRIKSKDPSSLWNGNFGEIKIGDGIEKIKNQYFGEFEEEIQDDLLYRKYQIENIVFLLKNNKLESVSIHNNDKNVVFGNSEIKWLKK